MKTRRLLLSLFVLLAFTTAQADVEVNETTFPDEQFRSYILGQLYGLDGVLTDDEIADVTFMFATERGIHSLKGIGYFTALTTLYCSGNQLTELDVSGCKALTSLYCGTNRLTSLNVVGCTQLTTINFARNQIAGAAMDALIESLPDLSADEEEGGLYAINGEDDQNQMTADQVMTAKSKGWTTYYSDGWGWYEKVPEIEVNEANFPDGAFRSWVLNQYGSTLTSDEIKNARYFHVNDQNIWSLKGIEYFTEITDLYCYNNQLTELDLSKNTAHNSLYCYNNQLSALDLSQNTELTFLSFYQNRIEGQAMDALIESLPVRVSIDGIMLVTYSENEQNVMTIAQAARAQAKGWTPKYGEGYVWTEYDAIGNVKAAEEDGFWYDLNGRRLQGKPTQKGIYIQNGRKVGL